MIARYSSLLRTSLMLAITIAAFGAPLLQGQTLPPAPPRQAGFNYSYQSPEGNLGNRREVATAPFLFAENIGQWEGVTRLQGAANGVTFRFARTGVDYFYSTVPSGKGGRADSGSRGAGYALRTEFMGASRDVEVRGEEVATTRYNYYLGADPAEWHLGARGFRQVRYSNLYPGIDALYYGSKGGMKYDFIVSPGSDPEAIALRYRGARSLKVTGRGELEVATGFGTVREAPPYSYQEIDGRRVPVEARYQLLGPTEYGFRLGDHDPRFPVVIDPCLSVEYSTYLSGGGYDVVSGLAVDSSGYAYATGFTRAPDFPIVPDTGQLAQRNFTFISKLSPDGSQLIYSTIIAASYSGPYDDDGRIQYYESIGEDIEVARNGEAIVAMTTNIAGLPVSAGAYMRAHAPNSTTGTCRPSDSLNFDLYVVRLDGSGKLIWGTYLGGNDDDYLSDMALDGAGNPNITGVTYAPSCQIQGNSGNDTLHFPVTVPRTSFASADTLQGFETYVARLSSDGRALQFSALYGGTGSEFAGKIGVTAAGKIILLGSTNSTDLPTTANAYQGVARPGLGPTVYDLYIARIDPGTGTLEYSSYFSDNGGASRRGLGIGPFTIRANQNAPLLGFGRQDRRQGLLLDNTDGVIVFAGSTRSTTLPVTPGAFMGAPRNPGGDSLSGVDCYLIRLNLNTNQLLTGTYLGGSGFDGLGGITYDSFGDIAVALSTTSRDFPVSPITIQRTLNGEVDGAIAIISPDGRSFQYGSYLGGRTGAATLLWEQSVYGITADRAGALYMFGGTGTPDFPLTARAIDKENDYYGGYIVKFAAPGAPQLGGGSSVDFDLNLCDSVQVSRQVIFNSGQTPATIESLRFMKGADFYIINPPALPLQLAACDTLPLQIAFRPTGVDCNRRALDTLIISAPNTAGKELMLPVRGTRVCISLSLSPNPVVDSNFRYGSNGTLRLYVNANGDATQFVTITPDKGNKGIFQTSQIKDMPFNQGTSPITIGVFPPDTGYYCESFDVTVQPCNRKMRLNICAYFKSGIYRGPSPLDFGLISCRELIYPFVVRNVGNDSLHITYAFVGGPSPNDIVVDSALMSKRVIAAHDSTFYQIRVWPAGTGKRQSILVMKTDDPANIFPRVIVSTELDSVAFKLSTTSLNGGFGDLLAMPVEYQPILDGRKATTELTFMATYDPKLLDLEGIDTTGVLTHGWDLVQKRLIHSQGTLVTIRMGATGRPLTGAGRLLNLKMRVLRGDSISTPLGLKLAGVSQGCLTALIDSGFVFQLTAECADHLRLVRTGNELLKQSMPNPAWEHVSIPFRVPEAGHVTLIVYDALGREVTRLIDEERPAGNSQIDLDTGGLPAGRYYYRLTVGELMSDTREMVIER